MQSLTWWWERLEILIRYKRHLEIISNNPICQVYADNINRSAEYTKWLENILMLGSSHSPFVKVESDIASLDIDWIYNIPSVRLERNYWPEHHKYVYCDEQKQSENSGLPRLAVMIALWVMIAAVGLESNGVEFLSFSLCKILSSLLTIVNHCVRPIVNGEVTIYNTVIVYHTSCLTLLP